MMTLEDVQAHLKERAYRPGWAMTAYLGDTTQQIYVQIEAMVEDSYNPGGLVPLDIRSPIPRFALTDALALDKWLAWRLGQIEIHESAEWFRRPRVNGDGWTAVFNPHRDGADRDQWPIVKQRNTAP